MWTAARLVIPRWTLAAYYALIAGVGVAGILAGMPTLDYTSPSSFVTGLSALLACTALAAAVASSRETWATTERWLALASATMMTSLLVSAILYLVLTGKGGTFIAILAIAMWPLGLRVADLVWRAGEKRRGRA